MATDNLVFEFKQRWQQVGALLFGPTPTQPQQEALRQLEYKDRDLEDLLSKPQSAPTGVTAWTARQGGAAGGTFPVIAMGPSTAIDDPVGTMYLVHAFASYTVNTPLDAHDYMFMEMYEVHGAGSGFRDSVKWEFAAQDTGDPTIPAKFGLALHTWIEQDGTTTAAQILHNGGAFGGGSISVDRCRLTLVRANITANDL